MMETPPEQSSVLTQPMKESLRAKLERLRPEAIWAIVLVVLFNAATAYALMNTDQGRDLLQVNFWSALMLFGGLSWVICLNVYFVLLVITHGVKGVVSGPPAAVGGDYGFAAIIALLTAILSGLYTRSFVLAVLVYFLSALASILFLQGLAKFRQRHPRGATYTGFFTSVGVLLFAALFPAIFGRPGSQFVLVILLAAWSLLIASSAMMLFSGEVRWPSLKNAVRLVAVVVLVRLGGEVVVAVAAKHAPLDFVRHAGDGAPPALPTLEKAYTDWRAGQGGGTAEVDDRPLLVLVAAAGGGIRASYWTSLLLTRLADAAPQLRKSLFAGSGVSGGSLGLGLTYSLLSKPDGGCPDATGRVGLAPCVQLFHDHDYLAAPLSATLAGVPANLVLPWFPSRSEALERGFEKGWRSTTGRSSASAEAFSRPMNDLWRGSPAHPLLLLNATLVSSGERALTADVALRPWLKWRLTCGLNLATTVQPPLSAAIGASARFPFITDPGWIDGSGVDGCDKLEAVTDGGYFDNYGAQTLLDLMDGLGHLQKPVNLATDVRLIVIQITSDPARAMNKLWVTLNQGAPGEAFPAPAVVAPAVVAKKPSPPSRGFPHMPDLAGGRLPAPPWPFDLAATKVSFPAGLLAKSPGALDVLMTSRSLNGIDVAERLRERTCAVKGSYYHFAMIGPKDIPLGWTLSSHAQDEMAALLLKGREAELLQRVTNELKNGKPGGECSSL